MVSCRHDGGTLCCQPTTVTSPSTMDTTPTIPNQIRMRSGLFQGVPHRVLRVTTTSAQSHTHRATLR